MPSLHHPQICVYLMARKRGRIILSLSFSTIITRPPGNSAARLGRHTRSTHFLISVKLAHFPLSSSSCCSTSPPFFYCWKCRLFMSTISFLPTCLCLYLCGWIYPLVSVTDTIHSSHLTIYLSFGRPTSFSWNHSLEVCWGEPLWNLQVKVTMSCESDWSQR